MNGGRRLRRWRTVMLTISVLGLLASIVMFFILEAGLARWLSLLTWLSLTVVFWQLRKAPAP
jgi:hypothetical protein